MIDLHMHSKYSDDGEFEPSELVEQCLEKSVTVMSVTDHNSVKANAEAEAAAVKKGIWYIPGIEIDCTYKGINFHVLGYGIDYQSADFQKIEQNIDEQSFQASLERLEQTQALGFHVTENDMWSLSKSCCKKDAWTGEMFAEILLNKEEYLNHPLLSPYRPGGARSGNPYVNFYWDFYSQGKLCYVKMEYPAMEEILHTIHANHGIAVLAHPGVNLKDSFHLIDEITALGFDGIEAFSSYHTPEEAAYFCQKAQEKQLLTSCGSDYHGKTKPTIQIGSHHCPLPLSDTIEQLRQRLKAASA